jgi:deazaflavin-dependent oxidoreductase (nitroreductase family)
MEAAMWFNPIMSAILKSPLHGLLSRSTMLITVRGRKSGRTYTTPVNYVRSGDELVTVSFKKRSWWRNLRGGAAVKVRLEGKDCEAHAEVAEGPAEVAAGLEALVRASPRYARYLGVGLDAAGRPEPGSLERAAADRVVIRARLAG